ncbi:MAG: rRNA maturation RNase YbeY [bacterium]|nr:rRNA maturation RNase YbeY [bacterium]
MKFLRPIDSFSITNTTKDRLPRLPFFAMKNMILGKTYELSLVFTGNALSQKLNKKYKKKNAPANILSFKLGPRSGEIFLDLATAKKEARENGEKFKDRVGFLLIHGLLHLKGYTHSSTMNKEEVKMYKKFHVL